MAVGKSLANSPMLAMNATLDLKNHIEEIHTSGTHGMTAHHDMSERGRYSTRYSRAGNLLRSKWHSVYSQALSMPHAHSCLRRALQLDTLHCVSGCHCFYPACKIRACLTITHSTLYVRVPMLLYMTARRTRKLERYCKQRRSIIGMLTAVASDNQYCIPAGSQAVRSRSAICLSTVSCVHGCIIWHRCIW